MLSAVHEHNIQTPPYEFSEPSTLLFLTGAALSGKSTISSLVSSAISGCVLQSMDIMRLAAQDVEETKPEKDRNPFVYLGSCDSYSAIGDGSYSPESLIEGFNLYSSAVFGIAKKLIPKLEAQGAQNVLFEGVQLTPSLVRPHLTEKNRLIIVTSDDSRLKENRDKMFKDEAEMVERYSLPLLLLIQEEILRQSLELDQQYLLTVSNSGEYTQAVTQILQTLLSQEVIKKV